LSILLSTRKKISRFWFGGIAAVTLGVVSFLNGATGSWILYWAIQFPLQFIGYYFWRKSSSDKLTIQPTTIKQKTWIPWLIAMVCLIALWSWIDSLESFQKVWYGQTLIKQSWIVFICDAGIFIIGLGGAIMMLFRYKQEWILWIILDILCIVLWSLMLNVQLIIMSSTALLNGCYGIYVWYKK
jgi:nicotinamide mononucleotide transporter